MGNPFGFRGRHTEETKAKIAAAKRGCTHSPETKAKMSAMRLGRKLGPRGPLSAEARAKVSAALKGLPKSDAHKKATSLAVKASEAFRQASALAREKAHQARRGQPLSEQHVSILIAANTGRVHTPQARANMASGARNRPPRTQAHCEALSRGVRESAKAAAQRARIYLANPSSIELAVQAELVSMNVPFIPQHRVGPRYVADLFVPSRNLIIECDGTYWHRNTAERDRKRDEYCRNAGYTVVRLSEKEIRAGAYERLRCALGVPAT